MEDLKPLFQNLGWGVGCGFPLASLRPTWDPHLYARKGLPRRPEDYSIRGPEDHNAGPKT